MSSLHSNDFELFNLPVQFAQDGVAIDVRWKELQREVHPDKFAAQGAAAQRVAMQWSVRINEAYRRLKDPLARATYLCEMHGAPINAETNTAMPAEFLMQQMALREALDDAETPKNIDEISLQLNEIVREQLSKLEQLIDGQRDFEAASGQVRSLMFTARLASEIDTRMERLGQ